MGTIIAFLAGLINFGKLASFKASTRQSAVADRWRECVQAVKERDWETLFKDRGFGSRD